MKLSDIVNEANAYEVPGGNPSGISDPVPVDMDKFPSKDKDDKKDRSQKIRRRFSFAKNMRSPADDKLAVKDDSTDLTGSGPNSAVNGPYNY